MYWNHTRPRIQGQVRVNPNLTPLSCFSVSYTAYQSVIQVHLWLSWTIDNSSIAKPFAWLYDWLIGERLQDDYLAMRQTLVQANHQLNAMVRQVIWKSLIMHSLISLINIICAAFSWVIPCESDDFLGVCYVCW